MTGFYYYGRDEQVTGPVSMDTLRALLEQQRIDEGTQLWSEARDWMPLGEALPQFNPPPSPVAAAAPPPLPPPLPAVVPTPRFPERDGAGITPEAGWSAAPPHPWRRYLGRMVDHYSMGLLGYVVATIPIYAWSEDIKGTEAILANSLLASMAVALICVPLCALCIGLSGTTPGKWCAGVRVLGHDGGRLALRRALARELKVWARGLGLGIPVVAFVTMLLGYTTLMREQRADWDVETGAVVHYRDAGALLYLRLALAVLLVATLAAWLIGADARNGGAA